MTDKSPAGKSSVIRLSERRANANENTSTLPGIHESETAKNADSRFLSLVADRLFSDLLTDTDTLPHAVKDNLQTLPPVSNALPVTELDTARRLENRFAYASCGQPLTRRSLIATERFATISRAILTGYCLEARYNHLDRVLHPFAILVREPKIYLLAVENEDTC